MTIESDCECKRFLNKHAMIVDTLILTCLLVCCVQSTPPRPAALTLRLAMLIQTRALPFPPPLPWADLSDLCARVYASTLTSTTTGSTHKYPLLRASNQADSHMRRKKSHKRFPLSLFVAPPRLQETCNFDTIFAYLTWCARYLQTHALCTLGAKIYLSLWWQCLS